MTERVTKAELAARKHAAITSLEASADALWTNAMGMPPGPDRTAALFASRLASAVADDDGDEVEFIGKEIEAWSKGMGNDAQG